MTGRMCEIPVKFGAAKNIPAGVVYVTCHCSGPYCFDTRQLRFQYRVVHAARLWRGPSDMYSARHVGTITAEYNTEVEDDEPALGDGCDGGFSMRQSRPRTAGDDGFKRHAFRSSATSGIF